jgi:hypothetical protein
VTTQEAFRGIRQIEKNYGDKFAAQDLHKIWPALLLLPYAALAHAIGEMKLIWKRMPTPGQVLDSSYTWSLRLGQGGTVDEVDEADAHFSLTIGFLDGRLSEVDFIKGLYMMARMYKNPEYARVAAQREENLQT